MQNRVQSLQPWFNSFAFPVSFPAGQRCWHSWHPWGAAAPLLRQHSQHESQEREKVRAEFCDFPVFPGFLVLLRWVLAVVLQCRAFGNNLWWCIFSRATKIRVELRQFELMEPKTGLERFCWLSHLYLAIETKLGRVLNLAVALFLIFFCDSSWKRLIKKKNIEKNLKRSPGNV